MLTGNFFIDALPVHTRQKLAFHLQPVKLEKGQSLSTEGQLVAWVHFPVRSVVSRSVISESGDIGEVLLTGREGAVGLESLENPRESINNCDVLIPGSAWRIGATPLKEIAFDDPALAGDLFKLLDVQSKRMARKMLCDRYHTVEQRFCTWLLGLSDRTGRSAINVGHLEAARALAVHRPTITEAMHTLRDAGAIELKRLSVAIADLPLVEDLACECRESFPVKPKKARSLAGRHAA